MYNFNEFSDDSTLYSLIDNPLFRNKVQRYLSHVKLLNYNGEYMTTKSAYYPQVYRDVYINNVERLIDLDYFIVNFEFKLPDADDYKCYALPPSDDAKIIDELREIRECELLLMKFGTDEKKYMQCPKHITAKLEERFPLEPGISIEKPNMDLSFKEAGFVTTNSVSYAEFKRHIKDQLALPSELINYVYNIVK